ncbi:MAG TPA: ABC transporter ATP-binding protein [Bacillota bacterium]|nr:ABC transporter ATP-binding protein [Clostridiales bacterium]HPT85290.1 ABC transporter ATP-binding protein [Bacillota bacterium]
MSQNGNYDAHEIKADELLPVAQQESQGDDGNAAAAAAVPLLECRRLTKRYTGGRDALSDINLKIYGNRIIGLLGPNGSGKTTFIKLICGLLMPTSGEVLVCGMRPGVESKHLVSYLPDRIYLNEWMRVHRLISFFEDFYDNFAPDKAYSMLERLGIDPDAKLKNLSKGTKEKVQLILTMSRRASLYLLDEPIGGVDPASRDFILGTILSNYNPGATVIISTHIISDVERILDDVIFLSNGKIMLAGAADEIREKNGKSIDELFREVFKC